MDIVVNEELKAYIDPLTPDEYASLERSILAEGCRDALVLWGDVLVDGHNRYAICGKHNLPFRTIQSTRFQSVMQIEKIQKQAAPEVVAAVKAGEISINAAATVASLPLEEQVAAATGGKEELKQAAKRVREARRKPAAEAPSSGSGEPAVEAEETIESLRQRVAALTAENMRLREQLLRLGREVAE